MTMIRSLGTATMTATGVVTAVALGETPFFPGANAILHLSEPVGGAGVISIQGAKSTTAANGDWTTLRTITAADGTVVELTDLPLAIRVNKTTVGTGAPMLRLEGVQ